jgi:DNA-binding transcriptional MerR regulator
MYRIGLFSKISKTTIKTLRYYDEVGLLHPAYTDEENGYRYYTTEQLVMLHRITALRQIGFSVDEVLCILNGGNVTEILQQRKVEIENELSEAADKLSRIKNFILEKEGSFEMGYQAVVKQLPECIVYSKRMVVPDYNAYFQIIPAIGEEVKKSNPDIKCAVPEYCFIVYHDGEYKEKDIDVEYCEAVDRMGVDTDDIKFKKIESVTAVSVLHKGPYSSLGKAYAYVFKWIEDNGYTAIDNPRESYIDGIWNKESEEDWLTELQVPIMKK